MREDLEVGSVIGKLRLFGKGSCKKSSSINGQIIKREGGGGGKGWAIKEKRKKKFKTKNIPMAIKLEGPCH